MEVAQVIDRFEQIRAAARFEVPAEAATDVDVLEEPASPAVPAGPEKPAAPSIAGQPEQPEE